MVNFNATGSNGTPYMLYLPEVALEKIFSFLTYDEIAKNRIACLSVDNSQKVLILGTSKDFGICKSVKKNGEPCTAIVNLYQCEFCMYHIKQEYQKCSKRSELQANFVGRGLTALRNKVLGKNEVFYAGKSYMAIPAKKSKKLESKDNNRLHSLSGNGVSALSNNITKAKSKNVPGKKQSAAKLDVTRAQRLRDLELLQKLGGSSGIETKNSFSEKHSTSVTLEESKNIVISVISKLKSKNSTNGECSKNVSNKCDGVSFSKDLPTLENNENTTKGIKPLNNKASSSNVLHDTSLKDTTNKSLYENNKEVTKGLQPNNEMNITFPTFSTALSGSLIDLNTPITSRQKERAKLNAIRLVKKTGGIKKADPNSTRGSGKKRLIEDPETTENVPKKSKLAESEFISTRFKIMMEKTSRHLDLLEARDNEEEDKYFLKLEAKEKMEEKMINTYKVACKAVRCLTCKYTSFSASDRCKMERHPLKVFDTMKRFFKCGNCGNRTVSLEIIPLESCKNCGSGKWEKTGMMKEKTIVGHSLSIRGGEQKFVNSVVTDASINLMVPDSDN